MARRQVDDQPPDLALPACVSLAAMTSICGAPQHSRLRVQLIERTFDEAHQVAAQDRRILGYHFSLSEGRRIIWRAFCGAPVDAGVTSGEELRIRAIMLSPDRLVLGGVEALDATPAP